MTRTLFASLVLVLLAGCAGKTAYDTVSPVGQPVGTALAVVQAPIQGAADSYATQTARTQENPYGR
ncbi:MAG: hypothetical protein V1882_02215 [Candidatus Omnitrophota bacterium]